MDHGKTNRVLGIYTELINGRTVHKDAEAQRYGVNLRTIQRDIDDIREYFEAESENSGFINFNIIPKSKFEERQRYVLAEPRKMIKHFQYYLLENSKEENTWYVGEQVGNDAIEFYKCCETLEDALSSL